MNARLCVCACESADTGLATPDALYVLWRGFVVTRRRQIITQQQQLRVETGDDDDYSIYSDIIL